MEMIDANLTVLMDRLRPQQFRLKKALAKVAANYDICIIDCPPDLDTATINAMCATDFILIPADCARWATKGLKEVTRQIYEIKENINPNLEILGIVATKYTRSKPSMAALATLAEQDIPMLDSVIRFGSKINEANDRQIPVSMCAPDSNPAVDYMALTEEVLQRMKALA
jgi:chromosome partitioning protein